MGRLVDCVVIRRIADALFRAHSRREIARFDQQEAARCQRRILLGLIHAAQATPFGRDHDFRRIRTEADYRRLLPLRTLGELRRASPPTLGGERLRRARRAAWGTAFAFVVHARPRARLLSGAIMFVGGRAALPALVRPYANSESDFPEAQARGAASSPTCLAGPAEWIASCINQARAAAGCDLITDIWPRLTAVLYSSRDPGAAPRLREALGGDVLLLETRIHPEGPVAVEDPRSGRLRFLFDHGVYFEFTQAAEAGRPEAVRHTLAEVEPGVVYEMALTTPAGLWACRTGVAVCFEQRDPPLFRIVEMPAPARAEVIVSGRKLLTRPACPPPAPHRQTAGIPAAPPGKLVHTPWSTPADRG